MTIRAVGRRLDQRVDLVGGSGEIGEAAGGAEHPAVAGKHRGQAIMGADRVGEPLGARHHQFRRRAQRGEREHGGRSVGEVEPPAGRRQRGKPHAEAEAQDLDPRRLGRQQPREPGNLAGQGIERGELPVEQRPHGGLAEEGGAGGVRPQDAAAVAAEDERGPAIEQRLADRGQRRKVEIGVGLAVHSRRPPWFLRQLAAGLILKELLIRRSARPVHVRPAADLTVAIFG